MLKQKQKRLIVFIAQIIFLIIASIYLYYKPYKTIKVVGQSMEPSFKEGQIVWATTLDRNYYIGDVVLIKHDEEILIKRIAYVPGQKILCANLGLRAFCPIPPMKDLQRQIKRLRTGGIHAFVYEIPKNHYYLIGDNESVSEDSRNFGAVKVEDIFAKVIEK